MARSLQLRDQFRIDLPRLLMLRFSGAVSVREVRVNLSLIRQIECKRAMYLLQAQCRIIFDHSLGRDPLAKQIDQ